MKPRKLLATALSLALLICPHSAVNTHSAKAEFTAASVVSHETSLTDTIEVKTESFDSTAAIAPIAVQPTVTSTTAVKTAVTTKASKSTTKTSASSTKTTTKSTSKLKTTTTTTTTTITTTEPPHMLGDINNDKIITGSDATLALHEYTLLSSGMPGDLSMAQKIACDINKDGIITGTDATLLLRYYTYLSSNGVLLLEDYLKYGPIDIRPPKTTTITITTTTTTSTSSSTESTTTSSTISTTTSSDPGKVQSITLDKYEITLNVGEGGISYVTMLPETAPDKREKWFSTDPKIASVDNEGWIVGNSPGECTITVQSVNNPDVMARIKVTVLDNNVSEIQLTTYEVTMGIGHEIMPIVTMLPANTPDKREIWTSSNEKIATVQPDGMIKGVSPGECIITVQSAANPKVKAEVKVIITDNRVNKIELDFYEVTIRVGFGDMPLVTMLPKDAPDKSEIWTSSNKSVATVNFEGWIMGIAPGECVITVQSAANPDIKAEVKVTVIE